MFHIDDYISLSVSFMYIYMILKEGFVMLMMWCIHSTLMRSSLLGM